jgi:hypothetical protein
LIKKQVTNVITHTIDWIEIKQVIDSYIKRKYSVTFPEDTQVRVISRSNAMVEPYQIRFKHIIKEKDDYEIIN